MKNYPVIVPDSKQGDNWNTKLNITSRKPILAYKILKPIHLTFQNEDWLGHLILLGHNAQVKEKLPFAFSQKRKQSTLLSSVCRRRSTHFT